MSKKHLAKRKDKLYQIQTNKNGKYSNKVLLIIYLFIRKLFFLSF
jgi:hypothetical protein